MAQAAGYSFNTGTVSGAQVQDLTGSFLDGTIVGSAAITGGKAGYDQALNCTGGALQIPVPFGAYALDTSGGIAVAAWVKLNTTTAAARCIASGKSSSALDWALYASNAAGNVEMVIEGVAYSSTANIRDGSWHHVMVVLDRVSGAGSESVKIVVDGTLFLSSTGLTTGFAYSGDAVIEAGRNALSGAQSLDGIIDDFRWWNDPVESGSWPTVRDNEQTDFQYGIYPFDNGTGDDLSIYNRDLTLDGSATFATGIYGSALKTAGSVAAASGAVAYGDLDRLSISGWMRLDVAPVGSAVPILAIADTGGTNKLRVVVNTDRTITATWVTIYGTYSVTSASAMTVGAWNRFQIAMNPTYVGIYLNSSTQQITNTSNPIPHISPTVLDLKTLYVGGDAAGGGQVTFDYLNFTRNYVAAPNNLYWCGPVNRDAVKPVNVARAIVEFNEGTGTTAADLSGFSNGLTLAAAGGWTASGVQGAALTCNPAVTGPGATKSSGLAWAATPAGWAAACWAKVHVSGSGSRIIVLRNGTQEVAHLGYLSGAMWVRLFGPGGATTGVINPSAAPITAETWTHLAASCNGETIQFFVNGVHKWSAPLTSGALQSPTILNVGGDTGDNATADVDSLALFDTPISASNVAWLFANPGALALAPQNVTLAAAHETDTAYPLVPAKSATLSTASETDTAYGLTATKAVVLATASETDAAHPAVVGKDLTVATASETDTAYPLVPAKAAALATAAEVDTASALVPTKTVILATAHETDTAYQVDVTNQGAARVLDAAHETDTAYAVTAAKTVTLATAHEIDRAFALIVAGSGPKWPVLTVSHSPSSNLEVSHGI
jgi:hypothetical protein